MTDIYDERAAQATDARHGAREAAAIISRAIPIEGICDPAYLANVIEDEMARFERDPDAPIIARRWTGADAWTGKTADELEDLSDFRPSAGADPNAVKAARAATIRIARNYGSTVIPVFSEFMEWTPTLIADKLSAETWMGRTQEVESSLREIQAHRRKLGMPPLDTHAAGWTELDVFEEAERIGRLSNPLEDLKHMLI